MTKEHAKTSGNTVENKTNQESTRTEDYGDMTGILDEVYSSNREHFIERMKEDGLIPENPDTK